MSSSPSDFNTVTQHPLQDVDLNAPSTTSVDNNVDALKNTNKKENWVKFDDDVNEGILGTNDNNNKNNNELSANAAATANRLTPSPIPPPTNPKRHSAAAVGGAVRARTPTLESTQQQQLDVTSGATPVQVINKREGEKRD